MLKQYYYVFTVLMMSLLAFSSCIKETIRMEGMAPIYVSPEDFSLVKSLEAQESRDQGSILEVGDYIYINERFTGIHVFDNSDPEHPEKILFWSIPGNTEFTIDGDYLYADNSRHLLTINIAVPTHIYVEGHIKDVYTINMENQNYPKNYYGRFECTEFDKGIVIGWELKTIRNPKCFI